MAERGWPSNREPTADEWMTWYSKMGAAERRQTVEKIIADAWTAHNCMMMNHEGEIHSMQQTINHLNAQVSRLRGPEGARKW